MSRHGNRWNVNEVLSLQREYELLEWTVQQIADKHNRSVMSIVYKLHAEGFTASLLEARGYTQKPIKAVVSSTRKSVKRVVEDEDEDEDDDVYVDLASDHDTSSDFEDDYQEDDSDDELSVNKIETKQADEISEDVSEVDKLTERVWSLETSVGEIGTMVKSLFDKLVTTKSKKLQPLRKRAL
jgi:hypothetical protein